MLLSARMSFAKPCVAFAAQKPPRSILAQAKPRGSQSRSSRLVCRAADANGAGIDPMQGWGGREIKAGELETDFGEKATGGNWDTEHVKKIPEGMKGVVSLEVKDYATAGSTALDSRAAELLRKQVLDWKLSDEGGKPAILRRVYSVKDAAAGEALLGRVHGVLKGMGHEPHSAKADPAASEVVVELRSASAGGVTERDFMAAAVVDLEDFAALLKPAKRARMWA